MENCEIYISNVKYDDHSWIDDIDSFLQQIYDYLSEIHRFHFVSLCATEAEVYNVNLKQTNYDSTTVYLKGVKYLGSEFLNLTDTQNLEIQIRKQLKNIDKLTFGDIEIRTSKTYLDIELGIVNKPIYGQKRGPIILESV
jgi:hypothetical protein